MMDDSRVWHGEAEDRKRPRMWFYVLVWVSFCVGVFAMIVGLSGCILEKAPDVPVDSICEECPDWTIGGIVDDLIGQEAMRRPWWSHKPKRMKPPRPLVEPVPGRNPW